MINKGLLVGAVFGVVLFSCLKCKQMDNIVCNNPLPDPVSFSNNIIPIFNEHCNFIGCHAGTSPKGHLNLSPSVAYSNLMKIGSGYIDTLNPIASLLYAQMISTSKPMPPSGTLNDCSIQIVLRWIKQKAKNN